MSNSNLELEEHWKPDKSGRKTEDRDEVTDGNMSETEKSVRINRGNFSRANLPLIFITFYLPLNTC